MVLAVTNDVAQVCIDENIYRWYAMSWFDHWSKDEFHKNRHTDPNIFLLRLALDIIIISIILWLRVCLTKPYRKLKFIRIMGTYLSLSTRIYCVMFELIAVREGVCGYTLSWD